jgi:hypothetical protein
MISKLNLIQISSVRIRRRRSALGATGDQQNPFSVQLLFIIVANCRLNLVKSEAALGTITG